MATSLALNSRMLVVADALSDLHLFAIPPSVFACHPSSSSGTVEEMKMVSRHPFRIHAGFFDTDQPRLAIDERRLFFYGNFKAEDDAVLIFDVDLLVDELLHAPQVERLIEGPDPAWDRVMVARLPCVSTESSWPESREERRAGRTNERSIHRDYSEEVNFFERLDDDRVSLIVRPFIIAARRNDQTCLYNFEPTTKNFI